MTQKYKAVQSSESGELKLIEKPRDRVTGCMASLLDGERECAETQDAEWVKYLHSAAERVIHLSWRGV